VSRASKDSHFTERVENGELREIQHSRSSTFNLQQFGRIPRETKKIYKSSCNRIMIRDVTVSYWNPSLFVSIIGINLMNWNSIKKSNSKGVIKVSTLGVFVLTDRKSD
jgi:hypothetical protein